MNGKGSLIPPSELRADPVLGPDEAVTCPASAESVTDPSPYLSGEVIGDRYRLERELGRGGMGVVWVAHALSLGVEVAVKLIRVSVAGQAVAARMSREAHAAARLGHPALVRVFDFGWTNRADPFLVMELVQGEPLSSILGREPSIHAVRAVQMLLPIADGLRLAHEHGIVHRDVKPENIFIASDALGRIQPKLLDFGIAKVDVSNSDLRLTQVGVALGSPEYMSPEQAQGLEDIDARTDVWSLAVVLYEMISGRLPFNHDNYNGLLQTIIHDPPDPIPEDLVGDAAFWEILERGLCKRREDRWGSMAEFGEALALWLYEQGTKEDISGNSIRAVWLDGVVSGVNHAIVRPASEPVLRVPNKIRSAERNRLEATTTEAVAHKRRNVARTLGQKRVIWATIIAILGGIVLGGLLTASFAFRNRGVSGGALYGPLAHVDSGFARSLRVEAITSLRRYPLFLKSTTAMGADPRSLPIERESAPVGPGATRSTVAANAGSVAPQRTRSNKTQQAGKTPRDFGF